MRRSPTGSGPWSPTAVLAVAAFLTVGCGADREAGEDLPLGKQVTATASFDEDVHLFAEPVRARLEVVVDRDRLDPERIELETRLLPYDVVEESGAWKRRGRFEVFHGEYVLRCLRIECVPEILPSAAGEAESGRGERQLTRLPPAQVVYGDPDGERRVVARAIWPELVSVSRIKESDVPSFGYVFKTSVVPLPAPDYRVSPTLLAGGLLAAALVLLVLPAGLAVGWLRRRRAAAKPVTEPEVELTPLERALLLVEWAREREDGAERREALEVLATELDGLDVPTLAGSARTLAWSHSSPAPDAADELVRLVRTEAAPDG